MAERKKKNEEERKKKKDEENLAKAKINQNPQKSTILDVSNLEESVTIKDLSELFCDIGNVRKVNMKGSGAAEIVFVKSEDAEKAVKMYDKRLLNGRAIKCTLAGASKKADSLKGVSGGRVQKRGSIRGGFSGRSRGRGGFGGTTAGRGGFGGTTAGTSGSFGFGSTTNTFGSSAAPVSTSSFGFGSGGYGQDLRWQALNNFSKATVNLTRSKKILYSDSYTISQNFCYISIILDLLERNLDEEEEMNMKPNTQIMSPFLPIKLVW